MKTQETLILENLINNEDYSRKVFPFLKEEYFTSLHHKLLFQKIQAHFLKYNSLPTKTSLTIEIEQVKNISEDTFKQCIKELEEFSDTKSLESIDWLLDTTENFCKDMALYLALAESLSISKDDDKKLSKTAIPELLSKALAVSFDTNVGHSYVDDAEIRYNFFHSAVSKVPFHLDIFNTITNGGCERKTANCLAAGTGIGKSMLLCDFAANYIKNGYNVIYITMEMAEEKIAQRIDANLMNIAIQDIGTIAKPMWDEKIERIKANCKGKLIIKEYPTGSANVGHFRYLIKELKQKQNFVPDIIIIDYLNICSSAKYKDKSNSYGYIKSICEEIRGLAVEQNVVLWSATQLNRCVLGDTKVITEDGQEKFIKDIKVGDKLLGKNGIFNTVLNKYINPNTKVYKITTKSGKQIICSANHLFPTEDGKLKSIDDGLNVGDNLLTAPGEDQIVSIKPCESLETTYDIELSGDRLFFANGILTHNSGTDNSDADITNISESMGGPMTFDFLLALISTEDLVKVGQILVKQLKNRYADLFKNNKFNIGVDRSKMKFYDLNQNSAQNSYSPPVRQQPQAPAIIPQSSQQPPTVSNQPKGKYNGIKV